MGESIKTDEQERHESQEERQIYIILNTGIK